MRAMNKKYMLKDWLDSILYIISIRWHLILLRYIYLFCSFEKRSKRILLWHPKNDLILTLIVIESWVFCVMCKKNVYNLGLIISRITNILYLCCMTKTYFYTYNVQPWEIKRGCRYLFLENSMKNGVKVKFPLNGTQK